MRVLLSAASAAVLAIGLLMGLGMAVPRVAHACSCIGPQPIADYAGPENVIFAGEALGPDEGGVRFGVDEWFSGTEPAEVVRIAGDFGNGASCGVGFTPAEGSEWMVVAWRPPPEDPLGELEANENLSISICQPFVDLSTPEGQALHADAVAAFGDGSGSESPPPEAPATPAITPSTQPQAPATPAPVATEDPSSTGPAGEAVAMAAVAGVIGLGVLVLVAAVVLGRRRPA
jgi:hypothetical protein